MACRSYQFAEGPLLLAYGNARENGPGPVRDYYENECFKPLKSLVDSLVNLGVKLLDGYS